jgi:hypothetical protein
MNFSSLTIFCTPDELETWTRSMADHFDLVTIVFKSGEQSGTVLDADQLRLGHQVWRYFLSGRTDAPDSKIAWAEVRPIDHGWLDVQPGLRSQDEGSDVLLQTVISAPNRPTNATTPGVWLNWLKRRAKRDGVISGLSARNEVLGGEGHYHDIRYSPGAAALHRHGVLWKQFSNGRVVFYPST